jgi:hypothetical protein
MRYTINIFNTHISLPAAARRRRRLNILSNIEHRTHEHSTSNSTSEQANNFNSRSTLSFSTTLNLLT